MINIPKRFKKMDAGDYVCKIIKVEIAPNKFQEPCLWLHLDIVEGKYAGYFSTIYQNRQMRGNNSYPCVYSQNMSNYSIKFFKQLLKLLIASNPDYVCTCEDGKEWNEKELEGLLIGVTFEEHRFTNGRGRQQINLIPARFKDVNITRQEIAQCEEKEKAEEQEKVEEEISNNEILNEETKAEEIVNQIESSM